MDATSLRIHPATTSVGCTLFLVVLLGSSAPGEAGAPPRAPTISPTPLLSLGVVDGAGPEVWTEIVGALRLGDGTLVAADRMTRELRYFSAEGESQGVVGGFGEGPGEFRTMSSPMQCHRDEVAVWDPALARVSFFDRSGEDLRQVGVDVFAGTDGTRPWRMDCIPGGPLAVATRPLRGRPPMEEGPFREAVELTLHGSESGEAVRVGAVAEEEFYFSAGAVVPRPLGASVHLAVGPGIVYVATSTRAGVRRFRPDGSELAPIQWNPSDFPSHDRERAIELWIAEQVRDARDPDASRKFFQDLDFPPELPFMADLLVDATGALWVQEFQPNPRESQVWHVFGGEGESVGRVQVPDGLRLLQVDTEHALGVWTDDLGVAYLRVHGVDR